MLERGRKVDIRADVAFIDLDAEKISEEPELKSCPLEQEPKHTLRFENFASNPARRP